MNRTLLLIVCDFLLLSLLAFGRFDEPPDAKRSAKISPNAVPGQTRSQDMVEALKTSLEEEQRNRQTLAAALSQTEQSLKSQQQIASEKERRIQEAEKSLQQKEQEARAIEQAKAALESRFTTTQNNLQQIQQQLNQTALQAKTSEQRLAQIQAEYTAAQTNLLKTQSELSSTSTEARLARERLAALEQEVAAREAEAREAHQRAQAVEDARRTAEVEKEKIVGQLKVAETEGKMTKEQLQKAQQDIAVVQTEKQRVQEVATELAKGVVQFAEGQEKVAKTQQTLAQEIRENRPLSPNTIFNDFATNRLNTDFRATRSGLLGRTVNKERAAKTILVSDGRQTYAIYHISDTPLKFDEFGKDWDWLSAHLYRYQAIVKLSQISFLSIDPRIVAAPVTDAQAKELGVKIYKVVQDPYKFQDALLIGATEGYYGEAKFQIDPNLPNYVRMEKSMFSRLVGKFSPTRGDLVFAKSGELLGMMVNDSYCALLTSFVPSNTIPLGANISLQQTSITLSQMQGYINGLPDKLH